MTDKDETTVTETPKHLILNSKYASINAAKFQSRQGQRDLTSEMNHISVVNNNSVLLFPLFKIGCKNLK